MTDENRLGTMETHKGYAYPPEDEISLVDLYLTLMRRRWVIIGVFVLILAAAGIYLLAAERVYEGRAVLEIGQTAEPGSDNLTALEPPKDLVRQLTIRFGSGNGGASLEGANHNGNLVTLTARGTTPEVVEDSLREATSWVIERHQALYSENETRWARYEEQKDAYTVWLEQEIAENQGTLNKLEDAVDRLSKDDPAQASVLLLKASGVRSHLYQLQRELQGREQAFEPKRRGDPTRLPTPPTASAKPVEPRAKLVLALGGVLGLMLGVFAAFFLSFLENVKREQQERR